VAIDNADGATVVEVHNGQQGAGGMWYHVGHINGTTINWGPPIQYDTDWNPSVAVSSYFAGGVVEVHNGQPAYGPMWCQVGQINGANIVWGLPMSYGEGYNPKVAWGGQWWILEVHEGPDVFGVQEALSQVGYQTVTLGPINWGSVSAIGFGYSPSPAWVDGYDWPVAVQVNNPQPAFGPMVSSAGHCNSIKGHDAVVRANAFVKPDSARFDTLVRPTLPGRGDRAFTGSARSPRSLPSSHRSRRTVARSSASSVLPESSFRDYSQRRAEPRRRLGMLANGSARLLDSHII
jgi:hypothetical protein